MPHNETVTGHTDEVKTKSLVQLMARHQNALKTYAEELASDLASLRKQVEELPFKEDEMASRQVFLRELDQDSRSLFEVLSYRAKAQGKRVSDASAEARRKGVHAA